MTTRRWWDIAFAAAGLGVVLITAISGWPPDASEFGALTAMGAIVAGYYAFGRFTVGAHIPPWRAALWCGMMIALLGVGVSFEPVASFMQAVIFPFIWVVSPRLRQAVVLNVLTGGTILVAYLIRGGTEILALGLANAVLSVAFSMALGLWITRIAVYGEERARLLDELTAAQGEVAAMHRAAGVASERERLAREIHDTIAQSLTAQVMLAQRGRLEVGNGAGGAALDGTLELIETGAREALVEARALVASMTPIGVGDTTLAEALNRIAERFERETGVRVTVDFDPSFAAARIDRELEVVLLRCSQEGLANVRKHAAASHVTISVAATDAGALLRVSDDGRGLAAAESRFGTDDFDKSVVLKNGFGVNGMRERVALVGGSLELNDRESGGAELRVSVPISTAEAGQDPAPVQRAVAV